MVECSLGMCKALGSISSTTKTNRKRKIIPSDPMAPIRWQLFLLSMPYIPPIPLRPYPLLAVAQGLSDMLLYACNCSSSVP